jgi:hypothetical protein
MQTQTMDIKIEDIVPKGSSFFLRANQKTYRLNPFTLADEIWMSETFGKSIQEVFSEVKMKEICRIVFRLMNEEDKQEFAAQTVKIMNEEGESMEIRRGGAELLCLLVSGFNEKIAIFQALLDTLGVSRPVVEKISQSEDQKKNPIATAATSSPGTKSSTPSHTSTAGRQNISSPARPGKFSRASKRSVIARM